MKAKLLLILQVAFLAAATVSCSRYETFRGDPLGTKIYTLDNGLKIYMSVNKEEPRLQTVIAVKVGGKNDPSETTGMAHYFEHLMFKGTQKLGTSDWEAEKPMLDEIEALFEVYRKTTDEAARKAIYHKIDSISYEASKIAIPNEYDKLMAAIGADGTNAFTSQDMTCYVEDIPSNQIETWAEIQADRFRNATIRGFHTELETIYEEKNMSLTQDSRKVYEAVDAALFPHHPYGKQTVLGTQDHLKNPSITLVKQYHDTYYVPNNMAVCVSGDFDPDYMVKIIKKYFGSMEPNDNLPELQFEPEEPITSPIEKTVWGLESENISIAWRLPGLADKSNVVANVASAVLYNEMAGLIDIDLNQGQKVLAASAYASMQPDYSMFIASARPKKGQTLEEIRDLLLEEVAKLRSGDFDEGLITSAVNNLKAERARILEDNSDRALEYAYSFCYGMDWKDYLELYKLAEKVTRDDVVEWANEYLGAQAYAAVYKRQGEDKNVKKISAPKITPIVTNRDKTSDYVAEVQSRVPQPIAPEFVDFDSQMSISSLGEGTTLLYAHKTINNLFDLSIKFNKGISDDKVLYLAGYLDYLGTEDMTNEDIAAKMFSLASSYSIKPGSLSTTVNISGLAENMEETLALVENIIMNAQPDEEILEAYKEDIFKSRANAKLSQGTCFGRLRSYITYGPEYVKKTTLSDAELAAVTAEDILGAIRSLFEDGHYVLYYGSDSQAAVEKALAKSHHFNPQAPLREKSIIDNTTTPKSKVFLAQYDATQLYYYQYCNTGRKYDFSTAPSAALYNEYFGGSMNAIVFQEMREARGLAYSASAYYITPRTADNSYLFYALIATQNDKMKAAILAFDDIINNMPESEAAFKIAKEGLLARLATKRVHGNDLLAAYLDCIDRGISEPEDKSVYEAVQDMTFEDVQAFQQKYVKGRTYNYGILGDIKDLDMKYLKKLGEVKILTKEQYFGY